MFASRNFPTTCLIENPLRVYTKGMKTLLSISIAILFSLLTACSTKPAPAPDAAAAPVVNKKLEGLKEKVEAIQKEYDLPAVQAFIMDRDETPFKYSEGVRAVGFDTPVKEDDKFHLTSAGKAMTAILVGQLIDMKLIKWNTTLREVLGKDIGMNAVLGGITVEQLLGHTSGLIEVQKLKVWPMLHDPKISARHGRELLAKSILSYDPQFPPGSKTRASDSGYIVLGWMLEKLTNFTWEELVKNKIFNPVGMPSCGFGAPGNAKSEKPDQPWGHTMKNGKLTAVRPDEQADFPKAFAPAGSVHCSGSDWLRFLKEVNLGLFHQSFLLQEETFQKLLSFAKEEPYTYSGFARYERLWSGGPTLMLSGSNTFSFAISALAPNREIALVVLTNSGTSKAQEGATKILKLLTETVQ